MPSTLGPLYKRLHATINGLNMSTEKEDQNWLAALGGKRAADKSAPETIEAQALRSAMLHKIQNEEQFEPSHAAYQKILEEANKRKLLREATNKWNWFGPTGGNGFSISGGMLTTPAYAMASVVLIVGLTVIAGYQASELKEMTARSTPAEVFRGVGNETIEDAGSKRQFQHEVPLKSPTPLTTLQSIITAGLDADVVMESRKIDSGYQISIFGLKPMDKRQVALKAIIGLPNQTQGNVKVVILEK